MGLVLVLLVGSGKVATWLSRPAIHRAIVVLAGMICLPAGVWFFIYRLQQGYIRWGCIPFVALSAVSLFWPRKLLEEQARRFEVLDAQGTRRVTTASLVIAAGLFIIGCLTLWNGMSGLG